MTADLTTSAGYPSIRHFVQGATMKRLSLVLVLLAALCAPTVHAQTICETSCETGQAQPFVVLTDADPTATSYAVWVNGIRSQVVGKIVGANIEFAFLNGLTRGSYSFVIIASDAAGEVWRTDPNALTVKPGKHTLRFRG